MEYWWTHSIIIFGQSPCQNNQYAFCSQPKSLPSLTPLMFVLFIFQPTSWSTFCHIFSFLSFPVNLNKRAKSDRCLHIFFSSFWLTRAAKCPPKTLCRLITLYGTWSCKMSFLFKYRHLLVSQNVTCVTFFDSQLSIFWRLNTVSSLSVKCGDPQWKSPEIMMYFIGNSLDWEEEWIQKL